MLTICRTLMGDPDLIMIDEPTEGLSPQMVERVGEMLGQIAARGVSILLVEQNVAEALAVADRAYVVEGGRVVKEGAASLLARDPGLREAYLGLRREESP
jgi:branched-chain amino acid transport system ATP-binding protein